MCREVLKLLEFGLITGGKPVAGGVVFELPPPEPGLCETPEQCARAVPGRPAALRPPPVHLPHIRTLSPAHP